MTKVGLVTITYNSDPFLERFVACLNETRSENALFLVVIDNDSKIDPTAAFEYCTLEKEIVRNDANIGVARANNQGAQIAIDNGCNVVIFLNNDIKFDPLVIEKCVHHALQHDVIVSPRIFADDTEKNVWFENGTYNPKKGWTGEHCSATVDGPLQPVSYMPTCFACMPVEIFEKVGRFDPTYFVYFDDTDFMFRASGMGIDLVVLMEVELIHRIGGTTGGVESPFTAYQTSKNRLLFLKKHKGTLLALAYTPLFLLYYIMMVAIGKRNAAWFRKTIGGTMDAWRA